MARDMPTQLPQPQRAARSANRRIVPAIPHALAQKSKAKIDDPVPLSRTAYDETAPDLMVPFPQAFDPPSTANVESAEVQAELSTSLKVTTAASTPKKYGTEERASEGNSWRLSNINAEPQTAVPHSDIPGVASSGLQPQKTSSEDPDCPAQTQAQSDALDVEKQTIFGTSFEPAPASSSSATSIVALQHPPPDRKQAAQQLQQSSTSPLVFGGYRDSANSSPAPILYGQPTPPLQGRSNGATGGIHGNAMDFVPLRPSQQEAPSGITPLSVSGPTQQKVIHPAAAPSFNHFPNYNPNVRPPTGEDMSYMNRYTGPQPSMTNPMYQSPDFQYHGPPPQFNPIPTEFVPHRLSIDGSAAPESTHQRISPSPLQSIDHMNISNYIHAQFGNREFSDYIIQLSHTRYLFPPATIPAHGIILARSPKLRSLMRILNGDHHRGPHQIYPKFLVVACSDRFLSHEVAFFKAIMRLYGEPLPGTDFVTKIPCPPMLVRQEAMRFALSYAAAGHFLQADDIITHALELASDFIGWDTIASALAFALEGGLSPSFTAFESTSEDKASTSSFDDIPPNSPVSTPTYGFYSDRMLHQIIQFIAQNCPNGFQLSVNAPQLPDIARLPAAAEPHVEDLAEPASASPDPMSMTSSTNQFPPPGLPTRSDSRFRQIRFGEMATTNATPTAPQSSLPPPPVDTPTAMLSSILISLPFTVLKYLFEATTLPARWGPAKTADTARAIIAEREQRRRRALSNPSSSGTTPALQGPIEERLWRNTRWVERVEPVDNTLGVKLVRHVGGIATPGSGESQSSEAHS